MNQDTPSLSELILGGARQVIAAFWTSLLYKVKSYDATNQQADVDPVLEGLPSVRCQVAFLGGGGITHTITEGDLGLLIPLSADHSLYLKSGSPSVPTPRRNALSHSIFIPLVVQGLELPTTGLSINDEKISIGAINATKPIPFGDVLLTYLGSLKTWLDTHSHSSNGSPPTPPLSPSVPTSTLNSTKSFVA